MGVGAQLIAVLRGAHPVQITGRCTEDAGAIGDLANAQVAVFGKAQEKRRIQPLSRQIQFAV